MRTYLAAATAAVVIGGAGTLAAAPAFASPRAISHFDDGSFETPTVAVSTFDTFSAGQSFGPWRVTSGTIDLIGEGFWQAAEGGQSVDLNGTSAGAISQTFTTVPGTTYTVAYSLAGNPGGQALKTGKVLIDGQNFQDFSFDTTGKTTTDMGYVRRQVTFVATKASTTLTFASTTPNSAWGPAVDDVTVQPCPPVPCCG
ncbi:choice-of-anchor C family protein [Saccharopolyspora phatthalungensis]|uniref:Choice-of-anchor C domain-containing protein n=1 Tax=Saccharopolyspora phatthalungensis TaxID=664693 RepID=A0A840Q043_9PSEU|nr:choice-of-anchor C family protein [Saccharopolyspora phatthalungensis]MBB5152871.1 choice-of-anchor C domain-containing protein [Saccharopolyspora phatthalungensis]